MNTPGSLQCLRMVLMADRSALRPITRVQRTLPFDDRLGPADERFCKGAIAYDAGRGFRPFSDLVAWGKGERMHQMRWHVNVCICSSLAASSLPRLTSSP
jgi:hypothetical protein